MSGRIRFNSHNSSNEVVIIIFPIFFFVVETAQRDEVTQLVGDQRRDVVESEFKSRQ